MLLKRVNRERLGDRQWIHVPEFKAAIERLDEESFCCILLAVDPSEKAGWEQCARLQASNNNIPLVVLSDSPDIETFVRAIESGAQDHFVLGELSVDAIMRRIYFAVERQKWDTRRACLLTANPTWLAQETARATAIAQNAAPSTDDPNQDVAQLGDQLLLVEDDPAFLELVQTELQRDDTTSFRVHHVACLASAVEWLETNRCDCILLDLSLPDSDWFNTLAKIHPRAGISPIVALTWHDNTLEAIEGIRQGAQDYLVKSQLTHHTLFRAVRMAIARRNRIVRLAQPRLFRSPKNAAPDKAEERRIHSRYCLSKPIFTIPILPGGAPDLINRSEGSSVDLSEAGIGFEIASHNQLPSKQLVIGIEGDDGVTYFSSVEVRHTVPTERGIEVGAQFHRGKDNLFAEENLIPRLDAHSCHFQTSLLHEVLSQWTHLGILCPSLVDRVYVCPKCEALATFRTGCRACGSIYTVASRLIHHFACAHVGYVVDFEQNGEIVCPKCRARGLVVGADFEYVSGPYRCLSCDWSDTELETVGGCLRCSHRFPAHQSTEKELIGYHANRLDPLALIGAS